MRGFTVSILFLCFCFQSSAKDIPLAQAEQYAIAAYKLYAKDNRKSDNVAIADHATHMNSNEQLSYYLFNMENGGFVILSADDSYHPVLGFSTTESLDFINDHAMAIVKGELSGHETQIAQSKKGNYKSSSNITSAWSTIKEVAETGRTTKSNTFQPVVAPLTTTKWNQSGFYNASCPADAQGPNGRTYCGCLPIALSQLLKYYENPAPGNGSAIYEDPIYGLQEANICGQQFDYANMPDVLTEENTTLTDFIYDVGKMTRTEYSTSYTATFVSVLENTLVYNYGYDSDIKAYQGTDQAKYSSTLRSELDEDRIVFLAGWSIDELERPVTGHTWLADGYGYTAEGVEYMHFNWGWGGSNNGWFLDIPGLFTPHPENPEQDGINYYWYRYTVYNIKPSGEACSKPKQTLTRAESFDNYAYLYFQTPLRDEMRRYRYKKVGTSDWITSEPTDLHYQFAGDLTPGTTYEYQVARNCCGGWSSYTDIKEFTTAGTAPETEEETETETEEESETNADCPVESTDGFFVTSVSDNFAYVYSATPYGAVNNQFRYKKSSSSNWTETDISSLHYRALAGLDGGSTYEYQVRHECEAGSWSEYSASYGFTTTGMSTGEETEEEMTEEETTEEEEMTEGESPCSEIPTSHFALGYATSSGATGYLTQVSGGEKYRFRYRPSNSNASWVVSSESTSTAQNFTGLNSATIYEVQISQYCNGGWSDYSGSKEVTTL